MPTIIAMIALLWVDHYKPSIYNICHNTVHEQVLDECETLDKIHRREHVVKILKRDVRNTDDYSQAAALTHDIHRIEKEIEWMRIDMIITFYVLQE